MKLLIPRKQLPNHFQTVINFSNKLSDKYADSTYDGPIFFHCYWCGTLNDKHLSSILSCYYFNCFGKTNRTIILWLDKNVNVFSQNNIIYDIIKYATVKYFDLDFEIKQTHLCTLLHNGINVHYNSFPFYSDFIRYILLYNYGGIWFDLDILFLKSIEPILLEYGTQQIMVYEWEEQNYPNNAIIIIIQPKSTTLFTIIQFIINRNQGWGFQNAQLTYDLPLDFLVLPCEWFDPGWVDNPLNINFIHFFKPSDKLWDFDTFFPGAFCFHWHNKWNDYIDPSSIFFQLTSIIKNKLSINSEI
jgi:hypothetical protein